MFNKIMSNNILRLSVVVLINENLSRSTPILAKEIKCRHYARWSARKPSKVFLSDEDSTNNDGSEEIPKSGYKDAQDSDKFSLQPSLEQNKAKDQYKRTTFDGDKDYVVLGEHDFTFSKLMTYVGNRNMRRKHDLMMLEGKRLNLDAIQAGLRPKNLFFTQKSFLEDLNIHENSKIPLFKLPYKTIKLWSKLDTPPGIIGFYSIPREGDITPVNSLPIKVLCDNVRDPGNLGAIIRVAASVGCTQILLMKGCTDPWDSKVLRSASGGHFHIPISMDLSWSEHDTFLQPSDVVFLADSNTDNDVHRSDVPLQLYHDVAFHKATSIVVVVGGETEGLSKQAFSLAQSSGGSRIYIPLSNGMESLNSGSAVSVVLFEMKRQLLVKGCLNENRTEEETSQSQSSSAIG